VNAVIAYALQSIGWAGAGFICGVLVGRAARDVHRIATAVTNEDTDEDGVSRMKPPGRRPRWTERAPSSSLIAIVVVLLGVVTVVQGIVQSNATERLTRCQLEYSNAFSDALNARTAASTGAQDALDQLLNTWLGIGSQNATPEERRAQALRALNDYFAKRQQVKTEQQAHPYPAPPRVSCG
jgi:hypothetical protein